MQENFIKSKPNCRVCDESKKITKIPLISHKSIQRFFPYSFRDKSSISYFCHKCGSLSFFQKKSVNYKDGTYRKRKLDKSPPVDLPWSTITYKRHIHICKILNESIDKVKGAKPNSLLDFGGYNGFCAYGICQEIGIDFKKGFVADLDPNGLSIATSLGLSSFDLSKKNLSEYLLEGNQEFSLITAVHVLEHLENPSQFFADIKVISSPKTLLYVEVPSRYFTSLSDPAHLTTFSKDSMISLAAENGFELLYSGSISTPKESINYGYPLSSKYESKSYVFRYFTKKQTHKHHKLKRKYSLLCFLTISSISNISIHLIICLNYTRLVVASVFKLCKSLTLLFLSPFFALLYLLSNFFN